MKTHYPHNMAPSYTKIELPVRQTVQSYPFSVFRHCWGLSIHWYRHPLLASMNSYLAWWAGLSDG